LLDWTIRTFLLTSLEGPPSTFVKVSTAWSRTLRPLGWDDPNVALIQLTLYVFGDTRRMNRKALGAIS
jgi:hypothetical protein